MQTARLLSVACAMAIALALHSPGTRAADEPRPNPVIPADLEKWKINISAFGGTPNDRSSFRVSLAHDGKMKVEKRRVRQPWQTVFEGKLPSDEANEFFRTTAKIINDYREDRKDGESQDGWHLDLKISADALPEKSVRFLSRTCRIRLPPPASERSPESSSAS